MMFLIKNDLFTSMFFSYIFPHFICFHTSILTEFFYLSFPASSGSGKIDGSGSSGGSNSASSFSSEMKKTKGQVRQAAGRGEEIKRIKERKKLN